VNNQDFKTGKYDYMEEIAYTIKDQNHGSFDVRKTANAWFMDKTKVEKVIEGKKLDLNDAECSFHSGITEKQLEYFLEVHPHFCGFFKALTMYPRVRARITIIKNLDDLKNAQWFAERRMKDEFSLRNEITGKDGKNILPNNPYKDMTDDEINTEITQRIETLG